MERERTHIVEAHLEIKLLGRRRGGRFEIQGYGRVRRTCNVHQCPSGTASLYRRVHAEVLDV